MTLVRTSCILLGLTLSALVPAAAAPDNISVQPEAQKHAASPTDNMPADQLGSLYVLSCLSALAQGQMAKAEAACGQAIALNPADADAHKLRGYAYLLEHRFEHAEADFRVALKQLPNDADDVAGLGQSLTGQGRYVEAVQQFSQAVTLAPTNASYRNALCWARAGTGQALTLALQDCNQALTLAPAAPGILNSRGLVYLRMHQYERAIQDYSASLAAKSTQPSARFGRGLAKLQIRQEQAGAADIVEARRGDANIDELFILLGVLPDSCVQAAGPACPQGFPTRSLTKPTRPALTVSLQNNPWADDIFAVEIGRLEVMVVQIAHLAYPLANMPGAKANAPSEFALNRRLSNVVARFNIVTPIACSARQIPNAHCRPYDPAWKGVVPVDVGDSIDDAIAHIGPAWATLCAGHKRQCSVE
jgi:tetratricopeptide (TPR) repeat protein